MPTPEENQLTPGQGLPAPVCSPSTGWVRCGWIANPPSPETRKTYEQLKARAQQSDHGEERFAVDRADGSGADCYYREANT
jgi:hypothetical protein